MRAQLSNRDYEQLSAYLDGQLAPGDRKKLEERLRARPELKEALEDLSRTRALLRMAPRRKAPRNFTLTPEMVGDTGPRRKARSTGGFSLFPALSFASALAALLLVAVILFDFGPRMQPETASPAAQMEKSSTNAAAQPAPQESGRSSVDSQATPEPAATAGVMAAPAAQEAQPGIAAQPAGEQPAGSAPPVIIWQAGGGGGGAPDSGKVGMGGGPPSYAGGLGGGLPSYVGGMGGGGPVDGPSVPGINGVPLDTSISPAFSGNGFAIPPAAVNSLNETQAQDAAPETPAQPNPNIREGGPILGVPQPDERGEVLRAGGVVRNPELITPAPTLPPQTEAPVQPVLPDTPAPQDESGLRNQKILGLPALRLIEALLLVIGIAAGVAAFLIRKNAGR